MTSTTFKQLSEMEKTVCIEIDALDSMFRNSVRDSNIIIISKGELWHVKNIVEKGALDTNSLTKLFKDIVRMKDRVSKLGDDGGLSPNEAHMETIYMSLIKEISTWRSAIRSQSKPTVYSQEVETASKSNDQKFSNASIFVVMS